MRNLKNKAVTLLAMVISSSSASANESDALCNMYSKMGGALVEFMLPLTVQNFVDMVNGSNPELMVDVMLASWSGTDLMTLTNMEGDDSEIIGEAAGQVAIELLLSGQANNKDQVIAIMQNSCISVGAKNIISNQRKSRAATAANLGK